MRDDKVFCNASCKYLKHFISNEGMLAECRAISGRASIVVPLTKIKAKIETTYETIRDTRLTIAHEACFKKDFLWSLDDVLDIIDKQ